MDDHNDLRLKVAAEYGFSLYRAYGEKQVAGFLGKDISWFKRHRKAENIPFIQDAGGGITYLGMHVADMILLGKDAGKLWDDTRNETFRLESTGSESGETPPHGAPATSKGDRLSELASRLLREKKPKQD